MIFNSRRQKIFFTCMWTANRFLYFFICCKEFQNNITGLLAACHILFRSPCKRIDVVVLMKYTFQKEWREFLLKLLLFEPIAISLIV